MIFPYVKHNNIFRMVVLALAFIVVTLPLVINGTSPEASAAGPDVAAIDRIVVNRRQNTIAIWCTLPQGDSIYTAAVENSRIVVSIRKKEKVFNTVYIESMEKLPGNRLLITIQPPLKDAMYGVEKRDITLRFGTEDQAAEISGTVMLGSALQLLDLRAYTFSDPLKRILNGLILAMVLSLIFALTVPVLKKYVFKKDYIKKYQQVEAEDKPGLDPFTFESIEENDKVVVIENNLMLLRSWKRLYKLRGEKQIEALNVFFKEDEKSNLFKPGTKTARSMNRMWFGMAGAFTGWLLYALLEHVDFKPYRNLLAIVFDTGSKQFSAALYNDLLLAIPLGLGIGAAFLTADRLYGKEHSVSVTGMLYGLVFWTGVLTMFLVLQSLLNMYLITNNVFGNFAAWLCIGTGMGLMAGNGAHIKKKIRISGIIALAGFVTYQLCGLTVVTAAAGFDFALVASLLVSGSLLGALMHTAAEPEEVQQEIPLHEDTGAEEESEVVTSRAS